MHEVTRAAISTGLFLSIVGVIAAFAVGDAIPAYDATALGYWCLALGIAGILGGVGTRVWARLMADSDGR